MLFNEALRYLLDLGHETLAIKLGLRNIELLLGRLNNPERVYPAVQIAGTNGKGSTAVVLDSICRAAGIKTGLYTSPHLVSITERIRINRVEITQEEFARQATAVRSAAEELVGENAIDALPTFFEQVTAIALSEFRDQKVELAILETGLGGRLDATTAARAHTVAITAVSIDHQQYLGDTLRSIAAEKAAIIQPGVNAVIGQQQPEALEVILTQCAMVGVVPKLTDCQWEITEVGSDGQMTVTFWSEQGRYERVPVGLRGVHQLENIAVAISLAESLRDQGFGIPPQAIVNGIANARHPGRLELWPGQPSILFDGAHNVAGAQALRSYLDSFVPEPITMVFGAMTDKNLEEMATLLFPAAQRLVLAQPDNPRAATLEKLEELASGLEISIQTYTAGSPAEAIELAQEITQPDELICVTGSLYLIGDVQQAINLRSGFLGDAQVFGVR